MFRKRISQILHPIFPFRDKFEKNGSLNIGKIFPIFMIFPPEKMRSKNFFGKTIDKSEKILYYCVSEVIHLRIGGECFGLGA